MGGVPKGRGQVRGHVSTAEAHSKYPRAHERHDLLIRRSRSAGQDTCGGGRRERMPTSRREGEY